jgi:hypothetical protein
LLCKQVYSTSFFFYLYIVIRSNWIFDTSWWIGVKSLKVICTDLSLRDIKHLFYIVFCDFNFCGPHLSWPQKLPVIQYFSRSVCPSNTKVCALNSYILNWNSSRHCILAYYHIKTHILLRQFDQTIFFKEFLNEYFI